MKKIFTYTLLLLLAAFAMPAPVLAQGTYAVAKDETITAGGQITSVPNITLTYGAADNSTWGAGADMGKTIDGTWGNYTKGNGVNPSPSKGAVPTEGTFYQLKPAKAGTVTVALVLNAGKGLYVVENGSPLSSYNGITVASKAYSSYSFPVKAGSSYYVYCAGSKLGFAGFKYEVSDNTGGGDTPGGDDQPTATHNVSRDATQNQMALTLSDGTLNYYNTTALSKVDISDDNTTVTVGTSAGDDTYKNLKQIAFAKKTDNSNNGAGDITNEDGKVNITEAKGWQESAYAKWEPFTDATSYHVYIKGGSYTSYTRIDQQLVRNYGTYGRADMVGLAAGTYSLKVVPVIGGAEKEANANEATNLAVVNYDRSGFAHKGYSGVGAYNDDGTLKSNAVVLYVTKDNFNTISLDLVSSTKGTKTTYTGLGEIFYGKQKGLDTTPLDVRVIGCITASDAEATQRKSDQAGLLLKGNKAETEMNVTIEGIGEDAMFYGFGLGLVNGTSVEVRNLAFGMQGSSDDDMEIKSTQHVWVHNNDYFYGQKGSGDHIKGDGSLDSKDDCTYATFSYNRFHDSGKCNLCGMKSEHTTNLLCYHHNWFDHSDSRHPRVRTSTVHVWNNYYDGCAKYGIGATSGCSIFSEANYFRHTSKPMLSSLQGTDAKGDGTFSGEDGGIIKSYGNVYAETEGSYYKPITQQESATSFDVIEVTSRDEQVSSSVKTLVGGTTYNNFDTDASLMYSYTPDAAADVPTKVTGYYGAGRLNHGDIQYTIPNTMDKDYGRLSELDSILAAYKTSLVGFYE